MTKNDVKRINHDLKKKEVEDLLSNSEITGIYFITNDNIAMELMWNRYRLIVIEAEYTGFKVRWNNFVDNAWFLKNKQ